MTHITSPIAWRKEATCNFEEVGSAWKENQKYSVKTLTIITKGETDDVPSLFQYENHLRGIRKGEVCFAPVHLREKKTEVGEGGMCKKLMN